MGIAFASGTEVSRYRIVERIGAGGMGEVFSAKDPTLGRQVALKILPPELVENEDRVARFVREAKAASGLDHPHIVTIYEIGEAEVSSGGDEAPKTVHYIAMELIHGSMLAHKIHHERSELRELVRWLAQVADAVAKAHAAGIIHRDLKPENIMVTADGYAKVLDFGLAKLTETGEVSADRTTAARDRDTGEGVVLGTLAYMSPEQAQGKTLDARSDIFSFGSILYEAVTGKRPFEGDQKFDLAHAIVREKPEPIRELNPVCPDELRRLIGRCLRKSPERRYQSMKDIAIELDEMAEEWETLSVGGSTSSGATVPFSGIRRASWKTWLAAAGVVIGLLASGAFLIWTMQDDRGPTPVPATFVVPVPSGDTLAEGQALAISPDGTRFVYAARRGGTTQLYSRAIDQIAAVPLSGTEGATHPFFSPDGRSIAFLADDQLMRVPSSGGQPSRIADLHGGFAGASWDVNDTILFAQGGLGVSSGISPRGIFRVRASGGDPELVLAPATGESSFWWPSRISDRAILFSVMRGRNLDATRIEVLRLDTGERKVLLEEGNHPRYAASGHIVFAGRAGDQTTLRAVPFDATRLELRGSPLTLLDHVAFAWWGRAAQFDISRNGSLLYISRRSSGGTNALHWVDRAGKAEPIGFLPSGDYAVSLMFAPDGRHVGVSSRSDSMKTWVVDLERQTMSAFSPGAHNNHFTVWSPSGDGIVFASDREDGVHNLYLQSPGSTDPAVRLTHSPQHQDPGSWSPDGRYVAFAEEHPETNWDIWLLDMVSSPPAVRPLILTAHVEHSPAISPDGRWIAYVSTESGHREIYVERFPELGGKQQVSREGGDEPLWSRDGTELFYTSGQRGTGRPLIPTSEVSVWSVAVELGTDLRLGRPQVLFTGGSNVRGGFGWPRYDVSADGQRFLIMRQGEPRPGSTEFVVTLNWFVELSTRVPAR